MAIQWPPQVSYRGTPSSYHRGLDAYKRRPWRKPGAAGTGEAGPSQEETRNSPSLLPGWPPSIWRMRRSRRSMRRRSSRFARRPQRRGGPGNTASLRPPTSHFLFTLHHRRFFLFRSAHFLITCHHQHFIGSWRNTPNEGDHIDFAQFPSL